MSCFGDQHHFAPGSSRCDCGKTNSALATGGLPYPSWVLDEATRGGTPHSHYADAADPHTGRNFLVREYTSDASAATPAQRRRFVTVAKSLRNSSAAAHRILFPYTRGGRCYTVAETVGGTPLHSLSTPGRTLESACLAHLESLLTALRDLHSAGTVAGPLFHGNLRPENVLATSSHSGNALHLVHSLYLENLLREHPLPPEHFQQQDLIAAADLVVSLAPGPPAPAAKVLRLQQLTDPVLGATLEYLYGMHGARPGSARAALDYLHLLQRAIAARDRALFEQGSSLSASPRLRPFLADSAPVSQPPRPAVVPPPPPKPVQRVQPAPAYPPFVPVASPAAAPVPQSARPPRPKPPARGNRKRGGCLLPFIILVLLLGWVVAMLVKRPNGPTSLDFSAEPNPAPRRATVQLQWSSSGFNRVELDGRRVQANGSLLVTANAPHHYRLAGVRPDGSREIRDLELSILPRHSAKPSPGTLLLPQPEANSPTETTSVDDSGSNPGPAAQIGTGSSPRPGSSNSSPGATDALTPAPIVRGQPGADLQEANTALRQWAQAMVSNDPAREAACYAPEVDHYFLQSGVTQDFVRRYLTEIHNGGTLATGFRLTNVAETPQGDGTVEARLTKEVTLTTPAGPRQVTTRSVLVLKRIGDAWKISSERDLRTFTSQLFPSSS